jgi:hypothetical protein
VDAPKIILFFELTQTNAFPLHTKQHHPMGNGEMSGWQYARYKVGLYKLNAVDPQLEGAWFQPLSLSSDILVSSLCFQMQMQVVPLQQGEQGAEREHAGEALRAVARDANKHVNLKLGVSSKLFR